MNTYNINKIYESFAGSMKTMQRWLDESEQENKQLKQENKQLKDKLNEIKEVIDGYMPNKYAMCKAFDEIEFIIKEALKEVE